MKKIFRIVAAALSVLLALALCAVGLNRVVYGRSLKATLYEYRLRRQFATDRTAESEIQRLATRRSEPEPTAALPEGLRFSVPVGETDRDGLRVFTLNAARNSALVLYLHGGAYINGFNAHQWRFMDRLARETGCTVIAPAYHLAPWADYTRSYDDLTALYRTLLEESPDRRMILMGDSAGGGLALGLAEALAGAGEALPERLVLFSPWVDVSMDNPDIAGYIAVEPILHFDLVKVHGRCWAGDADTRHWQVSPLFGDMTGLPPVTLFCGTRELLYPDILLTRDKLSAAGVDVTLRVGQGLNHDWPLMPIPEADSAFDEIAGLVDKF
ncbi:MAG: alpha/beta hydrolase [Clostridia bacterium]|nr:alpha/beta hydrolase [Clostridia bacterium]